MMGSNSYTPQPPKPSRETLEAWARAEPMRFERENRLRRGSRRIRTHSTAGSSPGTDLAGAFLITELFE